ncbi:alpha/beta hydrolase family protein [Cohnella hashimotonis]|uniref:Alpha/beta hydrolase n=1 Tax=Cohnella hashimotonis TaxID=2826895 RepID=A0ABT6TTE3_9BACL|nr:alpha/beta hydrolase [Cohnella hashimotonis]MDI4650118.1 alpha/beta hydrolase [Cohnella hashimotonis]
MGDKEAGPAPARRAYSLQPGEGRLERAFAGDQGPWRGAIAGLWIAGGAAAGAGMLGAPTGFGTPVDLLSAVSAHTGAFALFSLFAAWALTFVPRLSGPFATVGGLLYTGALVFFLLFFSDMGVILSLLLACAYTLAAAGTGWLLAAAFARETGKRRRYASILALVLLAGAVAWAADPSLLRPDWPVRFSMDDADSAADAGEGSAGDADGAESVFLPLTTGDPSLPGSFAFDAFTYGSGTDRRPEFGKEAQLISEPVDASAYLKDWPLLRKWYWGFGPKTLPLNGRVWMPRGEGAFPLVLIVHGNHAMEDYSDGGYAYLGEQLASRGYIAVSVDENFLNYSVWSGIPDEDMKLRAWMLLRHIGQLRDYNEDSDTPFYGKVDLQKISLVGHSRGGQAVAMAADRDEWFDGDASLLSASDYRIVSIAAIAPTDTVVDGKQPRLRNISYLTLQGASDADINDFFGDRQYSRTTFSAGGTGQAGSAFKASLYIEGANHGQFNESWGQRDSSLPAGLFLRKPALPGEAQRTIAKGYLTAFMEVTLGGDGAYMPLFEDYRSASAYLPATRYVSRYESDAFMALARFDGEDAVPAHPGAGISGASEGVTAEVTEALDRQRHGKGTHGLALRWATDGSYTMTWGKVFATGASTNGKAALAFAMADLSRDLKGQSGTIHAAAIRIGLTDANGIYVELPLSDFASPQPLFRASITRLGPLESLVDDGKYREPYEPVFQTYRLPLGAWTEANPSFEPGTLSGISFVLSGGPVKVMLDDIGISPF